MKEIKRTKTIEEVVGYEAEDGKRFTTKEECEKYEQSADYAIKQMFDSICVKDSDGDAMFSEYGLFEGYGCGSEEYCFVVADIKTENELKIVNMFGKARRGKYFNPVGTEYIGSRLLIEIGSSYDEEFYVRGTEEEIVDGFKRQMEKYFRPEKKEG